MSFWGHVEENVPLYEFECRACGIEFEELVLNATEAENVKCPSCESKEVEKKISSFASVSKNGGSGSSCAPSGG
jgi:putative FmdB family regulatory protein